MLYRRHVLIICLFIVLLSGCYFPPPSPLYPSYPRVDLSSPNIDIAFNSARALDGVQDRIFAMDRNGKHVSVLSGSEFGRFMGGFAWSPDGQCVLFPEGLDTPEREKYGHSFALTTLCSDSRESLFIPGGVYSAWSPDGTKIAYLVEEAQGDRLEVIELSSLHVEWRINLAKPESDRNRLSWSSTGDRIAFGEEESSGDWGIYLVDSQGGEPQRLTEGYEPSWSPVRSEIAFSDQASLCLINADGSDRRCITSGGKDHWPSWSPDGEELVFESERDGHGEIYRINRDGSGLIRLTRNSEWDGMPEWRPTTKP